MKERLTDVYESLQGVIDGVARKDLILLLGDCNAKVGSNYMFWGSYGKQGLGEMNENGEQFADFCSFNKLVVRTENQTDHIYISSVIARC